MEFSRYQYQPVREPVLWCANAGSSVVACLKTCKRRDGDRDIGKIPRLLCLMDMATNHWEKNRDFI
jgi:hypothetical protein